MRIIYLGAYNENGNLSEMLIVRQGGMVGLVYPNELIKESKNVENVSAAIYSPHVTKKMVDIVRSLRPGSHFRSHT